MVVTIIDLVAHSYSNLLTSLHTRF
jgi:hypothetical protein